MNGQIQADPYGPNPLVADLEATNPAVYAIASRQSAPPTLFMSGDLPPFTASGVDPQMLSRLPFTMRHYAAAERDPAAVLGIFEQYADATDHTLEHQGLTEYEQRVFQWAIANGEQPMTPEEEDALMANLFGTAG